VKKNKKNPGKLMKVPKAGVNIRRKRDREMDREERIKTHARGEYVSGEYGHLSAH